MCTGPKGDMKELFVILERHDIKKRDQASLLKQKCLQFVEMRIHLETDREQ